MVAKRLVDLYIIGQEVSFPTDGDDIVVYLKKLQPFEQEVALARANLQRAKILTLKSLPEDDDEIIPMVIQVDENFTEEELVNFVSAEKTNQALKSAESRIAEEDEWAKDEYLSGLQESWADLQDAYHIDEDPIKHAEAVRAFNELKRYSDAVTAEFEKAQKRIVREHKAMSHDELRTLALAGLIEMRGNLKWLEEFKRSQVWQATRENADRGKRYFLSREEVDQLHPNVLNKLIEVYDEISVSPDQGKD